jgi:hypothetical protein
LNDVNILVMFVLRGPALVILDHNGINLACWTFYSFSIIFWWYDMMVTCFVLHFWERLFVPRGGRPYLSTLTEEVALTYRRSPDMIWYDMIWSMMTCLAVTNGRPYLSTLTSSKHSLPSTYQRSVKPSGLAVEKNKRVRSEVLARIRRCRAKWTIWKATTYYI